VADWERLGPPIWAAVVRLNTRNPILGVATYLFYLHPVLGESLWGNNSDCKTGIFTMSEMVLNFRRQVSAVENK